MLSADLKGGTGISLISTSSFPNLKKKKYCITCYTYTRGIYILTFIYVRSIYVYIDVFYITVQDQRPSYYNLIAMLLFAIQLVCKA